MGVAQVNQSFQNDGNFSQLDLRDIERNGQVMRIETFRCSQPEGEYGKTAAGTSVKTIAGADHLKETSNCTFRHIFSVGDNKKPTVLLEIREVFGQDGSMEIRTRDIDEKSAAFGLVLVNTISPMEDGIRVRYEIHRPKTVVPEVIHSPLTTAVTEQAKGLPDISANPDTLGPIIQVGNSEYVDVMLFPNGTNQVALDQLDAFSDAIRQAYPKWAMNVKLYERMGDFRDKCIHPGTNLTGNNPALASEFVLIRAYRMSLITLGRVFDDEMSAGANNLNRDEALALDTKPGVYSVFLSAYALNIGLYQLGLDKVHSDYGGIPMKLSPGSRLETGARPIVDSTNLNRMLALLAGIYYASAAVPQIISISPSIKSFDADIPAAASFFQ